MGLADAIRSAFDAADVALESLHETVTHEAWIGQDAVGAPAYATAVARSARVDRRTRQRQLADGRMVVTRAQVTFVGSLLPNGAPGRHEPVDPRDRLTVAGLPGGKIVDVAETLPKDPVTGAPLRSTAWLA